jgi:hypothetical protein
MMMNMVRRRTRRRRNIKKMINRKGKSKTNIGR